jgi:hypothetical protein
MTAKAPSEPRAAEHRIRHWRAAAAKPPFLRALAMPAAITQPLKRTPERSFYDDAEHSGLQ